MGSTVASVAGGLVTGVVAWTIAQLLLTPRLKWSPFISKWPDSTKRSGSAYRVKVKNASWLRSIAAAELHARVFAEGVDPGRAGTSMSLRFATSPADMKTLGPRAHTILHLEVEQMTQRTEERLHAWGHEGVSSKGRTLEALLALHDKAYCSVQVLANDGWTGALHYRESPRYRCSGTRNDIVTAGFRTERHRLDKLHRRVRTALQRRGSEPRSGRWASVWHPELQRGHDVRPPIPGGPPPDQEAAAQPRR
ncbi:hypothetical protein [Blastococcus sp. LR1]|uniref:hypothetical protein n=1 Tax=Blastococcus sp. LR1 TaxID=2877000 RepID=UPI001CCB6B3F|nr:hypothetical protein [Blastococcus sp. LR1]MCA0144026.1 hypothetical protein [Blastococcus sp. LR1]